MKWKKVRAIVRVGVESVVEPVDPAAMVLFYYSVKDP